MYKLKRILPFRYVNCACFVVKRNNVSYWKKVQVFQILSTNFWYYLTCRVPSASVSCDISEIAGVTSVVVKPLNHQDQDALIDKWRSTRIILVELKLMRLKKIKLLTTLHPENQIQKIKHVKHALKCHSNCTSRHSTLSRHGSTPFLSFRYVGFSH